MPKIGLEIHQRLDTGKLFCRCPTNKEAKPQYTIARELNLVKSEVFEVDKAAHFEYEKNKKFFYKFSPENSCLVELDEEPISYVNKEALFVSLGVALKLGMKIFDIVQVMRKIVIDGSNTSGFQRTMLLAVDGKIEEVRVETLCLEEESAGIISKTEDNSTYDLSRLGIPLIEIATAPEIKSGKHARKVAEAIGMLLRMTGKAMRGIGTIRQDLNVSVEGGARVEIKGAQELDLIERWVEYEIRRQKNLIKIISELKRRGAYKSLKKEFLDVSEAVYSGFPKKALERGEKAIALSLPLHKGILGLEVSPGRRYGSELSDYAKQAGVKGIIHSDENLEDYGIDREKVEKSLNLKKDDAFVIVVAKEEIAKRALSYVFLRASMDYVPEEVRKTLKNGSTSFLRPLPGKARMYPETDSPFILLKNYIKNSHTYIPLSYDEEIKILEKELKNKELAKKLSKSRYLTLYERLKNSVQNKDLLAFLLTDAFSEIKRKLKKDVQLDEDVIKDIVISFDKGKITKKAGKFLLEKSLITKKPIHDIIKEERLTKFSREELLKLLERYNYNISTIMKDYSLKIDGKELKELLTKRNV